jgi:hypothetical protein
MLPKSRNKFPLHRRNIVVSSKAGTHSYEYESLPKNASAVQLLFFTLRRRFSGTRPFPEFGGSILFAPTLA